MTVRLILFLGSGLVSILVCVSSCLCVLAQPRLSRGKKILDTFRIAESLKQITSFKPAHYMFLFSFAFSAGVFAQPKADVSNSKYDAMLKSLLKRDVPEISVDSLAACSDKVMLLDAREKKEYDVSHLKNAKHVGYDQFSTDSVKGIAKDKAIVVYCSVGYRSEQVTRKLKAAGYTNVRNLYGGLFEWKNKSMAVVDNKGATTERVHAFSHLWGVWLRKGIKVYN